MWISMFYLSNRLIMWKQLGITNTIASQSSLGLENLGIQQFSSEAQNPEYNYLTHHIHCTFIPFWTWDAHDGFFMPKRGENYFQYHCSFTSLRKEANKLYLDTKLQKMLFHQLSRVNLMEELNRYISDSHKWIFINIYIE